MNRDPLGFLEETLPAEFASGLAALAASTAPHAASELEDVRSAKGSMRVVVEGEGERWVSVSNGALTVSKAEPAGIPVRGAIAFSAEAARSALELLEESGQLEDTKSALTLSRLASQRAEKILADQRIEFHVVVVDLPDGMDDVTVRCGVGVSEPPTTPQFTATISYDDIEDLREGDLTPQQVIGRLKLTGDASRAMALGMSLFAPPKK